MPTALKHSLLIDPEISGLSHTEQTVIRVDPGEFYISDDQELIYTRLGSCVSACIWDPFIGVGGLNHFLLPDKRSKDEWQQLTSYSCRYGNWAMETLINGILNRGGHKNRLKAKVFGGAKMYSSVNVKVGESNIEFVRHYLAMEGIDIVGEDLGGELPRKVLFYPQTGKVLMKALPQAIAAKVSSEEIRYREALVDETKPQDDDIELF